MLYFQAYLTGENIEVVQGSVYMDIRGGIIENDGKGY